MRKFSTLLMSVFFTGLAGCGGGGGDNVFVNDPGPDDSQCSVNGQKQFVLDSMRSWYLWNDRLPANVDLGQYATAEALLSFLTTFSPDNGSGEPLDRFSFINSAAADSQFFGEGRFEGYGISSRFVAADDLRLTRVFSNGPAGTAGLERGQRILALNGRSIAEIQAAEGVNAVLNTSPVQFTMREINSTEFTVSISRGIVTIDPIPQSRIIDAGGGRNVGYLELSTFISPANAELDTIFGQFRAAGVNDVIIDMRYNGGGLVSTAELLGDYLGGDVAENLVFSKTVYNADLAADNNRQELFERRGNSISLSQLVIIASRSTASASELVANSMDPHVTSGITIVGDRTFGKPVGQVGIEFCSKILRPTSFETLNANDVGGYFDGLPVDCPAADDLNVAVGADTDPNVISALGYLNTGTCPVLSLPPGSVYQKTTEALPTFDRRGPPHREYLDAF